MTIRLLVTVARTFSASCVTVHFLMHHTLILVGERSKGMEK